MFFRKKAATTCAVCCVLAASMNAFADDAVANDTAATQPVALSGKWLFNFSVEDVSFDEEVAAEQFIDSSALAFNLDAEYFFNDNFSGTIGFGFIQYDDNDEFSQETESAFGGDRETSESTATGIPLYFDLGYTRFYGTTLPAYLTVRSGLVWMAESERSISNCSDCYSEDIEIDGGAFALVGAGLNLHRNFSLGVYYKNYLTGDMEDAAGLKLSFGSFRSQ